MAWRLSPRAFQVGKGAGNRRALRRLVTSGPAPGILAYDGSMPIGWCAVAPRSEYSFLERSRVLRPVDERPVWSISCLFVLKPYRRQGISARLVDAAVKYAARRGAAAVEGYPTIPFDRRVPDPFLWTGTLASFKRAGFTEVARRSKGRPIVRRACR
jgi:GNAT superfamily N-acetyltransferase